MDARDLATREARRRAVRELAVQVASAARDARLPCPGLIGALLGARHASLQVLRGTSLDVLELARATDHGRLAGALQHLAGACREAGSGAWWAPAACADSLRMARRFLAQREAA